MAGIRPQVCLRLGDDLIDGRWVPWDFQVVARGRILATLARWGRALRTLRGVPDELGDGERPSLDDPALRPRDEAAVGELIADLQFGLDGVDADRYDARFAADVLWGTPYGATLAGTDGLLPIHRRLMAAIAAPPSRFEVVQLRASAPGVAVAHIRRQAVDEKDGAFSEMTLYVLVERGGRWRLAAGQNTPIGAPPGR